MKKLIIILIIILMRSRVYAPEITDHNIGWCIHSVYHRQKVIQAVAYVESRNNPLAYNHKENAVGLLQIRQIRLDDYNIRTHSCYVLSDMYDSITAIKVFDFYAHSIGYVNTEEVARCWNGGSLGMFKPQTKDYYNKVLWIRK